MMKASGARPSLCFKLLGQWPEQGWVVRIHVSILSARDQHLRLNSRFLSTQDPRGKSADCPSTDLQRSQVRTVLLRP